MLTTYFQMLTIFIRNILFFKAQSILIYREYQKVCPLGKYIRIDKNRLSFWISLVAYPGLNEVKSYKWNAIKKVQNDQANLIVKRNILTGYFLVNTSSTDSSPMDTYTKDISPTVTQLNSNPTGQ